MKVSRTKILIFIAVLLGGLVIAEYYPIFKPLLKKEINVSGFTIIRPDGFQIIGDRTILSLHEPLSLHFGQMKKGKDVLEKYKKYMESKGTSSTYETIKVGCKTGIGLRTITPDGKIPSEDIYVFVEPDLSIKISMPYDNQRQQRQQFLQNFLQHNVACN